MQLGVHCLHDHGIVGSRRRFPTILQFRGSMGDTAHRGDCKKSKELPLGTLKLRMKNRHGKVNKFKVKEKPTSSGAAVAARSSVLKCRSAPMLIRRTHPAQSRVSALALPPSAKAD